MNNSKILRNKTGDDVNLIIKCKCPKCNKVITIKVNQESRKKATIVKRGINEMYKSVHNCTIAHGDKYFEEYDKW